MFKEMNTYRSPEQEEDFIIPQSVKNFPSEFHPDVYRYLPKALSDACSQFSNPKEKDIILLGALSVISGCLPFVCGMYDMKTVYPNFFVFIEAPAGAGKGILQWTRKFAEFIHKDMLNTSAKAYEAYQSELRLYRNSLKKKTKEPLKEIPGEPARKMLIIPANNSASSFLQTLSENDGAGLLFCTEADTLANSLSQDWGNYSDVLRCAFQHEPISLQRRTNREYLELSEPRLSALLTGTKDQLFKLIPSTENGLFSRFAFYSFPAVTVFKDVFIDMEHRTLRIFNELGQQMFENRNRLISLGSTIEWQFNTTTRAEFKSCMNDIMQQLHKEIGDQCLATVKRLGLILFRIAMITGTLRVLESGKNPEPKMTIDRVDFGLAYEIVIVLAHHAIALIAETKNGNKNIVKQRRLNQYYDLLPDSFTRKQALQLAEKLDLSPASCDRFLSSNIFTKPSYGNYTKSGDQNDKVIK